MGAAVRSSHLGSAPGSSVGPSHRVTSPSSKTALAWPSLHGSTGPARSLLQCGLPTGSQPPPGIPLLRHGVLPGLQVGLCSPPVASIGCRGTACLTTGCRGTSALVPGAPPAPPSALTVGSAELLLSHTLLSLAAVAVIE